MYFWIFWLIVWDSVKWVDQDGRTAIALYKAKIKTRELMNLRPAVQSLQDNIKPSKGHSHHLGPWRRSKKCIHKSADLINAEQYYNRTGRKPLWQHKAMQHAVKKVHTWLRHADEQVYEDYAAINVECYFGEAYLMAVLNEGGSGPHYDKMDDIVYIDEAV